MVGEEWQLLEPMPAVRLRQGKRFIVTQFGVEDVCDLWASDERMKFKESLAQNCLPQRKAFFLLTKRVHYY